MWHFAARIGWTSRLKSTVGVWANAAPGARTATRSLSPTETYYAQRSCAETDDKTLHDGAVVRSRAAEVPVSFEDELEAPLQLGFCKPGRGLPYLVGTGAPHLDSRFRKVALDLASSLEVCFADHQGHPELRSEEG